MGVYFPPVPSGIAQIQAGKLKAIAVTSLKRTGNLPGTPTLNESGLAGYEAGSWYGLVVPPGTPAPIVRQLHAMSQKALPSPAMRERMKVQGLEAVGSSPAEFDARIRRDIDKWRRVFRDANIVMQ